MSTPKNHPYKIAQRELSRAARLARKGQPLAPVDHSVMEYFRNMKLKHDTYADMLEEEYQRLSKWADDTGARHA